MNVKVIMTFMCLYFAAAFIGGFADGKFLTPTAEASAQGAMQSDALVRNPFAGTGWNPVSWFTAGIDYITDWADVLTLNFSVFQGSFGLIIRAAILTIVAAPILFKIVMDRTP